MNADTPNQDQKQPTIVHVARPLEPEKVELTPEQIRRHERSKRIYPALNLSEGEYVVRSVRRHPIGLVLPLGLGIVLLSAALSLRSMY